MKNETPSPHVSLKLQIMHLKSERFENEERIKRTARSIVYSLHPATLAREAIHELSEDRQVQVSATQTALMMGSRFLVYKILGRFGGLFGVVGAAAAGKLSDKYMNEAAPKILNVIGNLLSKRKRKSQSREEEVEEVEIYSI